GADAVEVLEFARLAGGAIQDNHALTVMLTGGTHPGRLSVVVRSDAPSRIAASLTRAQEFHVLAAAHEAGVTVPRPLWLCEDESVAGHVFCVMERVAGSASPRRLLRGALGDDQARALTRRLGVELARLHQVHPPRADLGFLPIPSGNPALWRVGTYRAALADIPQPHPVLEWALDWLRDHAPVPGNLALCHCDFRTGNYMVDDGRLTAVLDWEFATWSDPYEDLGWLCCKSWRFGANDHEVGGLGDKADLFEGYAGQAGHEVDAERVRYWEIMGFVRWAVIALQQAQRHLSGEQLSLELALTGRMVPEMEFDLLSQIRGMEAARGADTDMACRTGADEGFGSGHPRSLPATATTNLPSGADLLDVARDVLLNQLASLLPSDKTYEAKMVARAMAVAARELKQRDATDQDGEARIAAFLREADLDAIDTTPSEHTLARLLRNGDIPSKRREALSVLLMALTRAKLAINNPRYLS
ncbi:MAG TPA: phosphotransferase, partial [Burkholderiaceae bacterium]|nr:phosphotransferase [Burkholderiaceae bacterium]